MARVQFNYLVNFTHLRIRHEVVIIVLIPQIAVVFRVVRGGLLRVAGRDQRSIFLKVNQQSVPLKSLHLQRTDNCCVRNSL